MAETGTAGELITLALQRAGVEHLFTLNGAHIWPMLTGAEEHGIRILDVRHEQSAAFAAEGMAKLTRRCGVASVTAGPGVTNTISAIATARFNDSPVFVVGGRSPASRWGLGSLQEIDHQPLVRSLTKTAQTLGSAEDAYRAGAEGVRIALSQRSGPTFLDVPFDTFFSSADAPEATEHLTVDMGAEPDPDQLKLAAELLKGARSPLVIAGGTVWWAGAERDLVRFVECAGAPVLLNGLARGMLPPGHPLFRSRARSTAFKGADVVFVVGAPLDFRFGFGEGFRDDAKLVYVDVDDYRKHRNPEAAIYGDLRRALAALAKLVEGAPRRQEWLDKLAEAEAAGRAKDRAMTESDSAPVHPARLVAEVDRFCDPDAILIGDGGDFVSFAGRLVERREPGLWMDAGPFGCLGAGPGYAMAATMAHPDRQVLLLSGDGAFGFSAMEFDTMVRHRLPVVCVVGNNGIWALEKHPMQNLLSTSIAADLGPRTRYDRVVEALGGYGELVERPGEIGPALRRAFDAGVPACVNVLMDPTAEYPRSAMLM